VTILNDWLWKGCGLGLLVTAACSAELSHPGQYASASAMRGAHLYDDWQTTTGTATTGNNPLYAQTTGQSTGATTWRCKECHGVDYRGKDGFYATGTHATGVKGLLGTAANLDADEIYAALSGPCLGPANTAAGGYLSDADRWDLVKFIREGIVDVTTFLDATGAPVAPDLANGQVLYEDQCKRCHGADGAKVNIGTAASVSYVGTEVLKNGFNFQHRVRFGPVGVPGSLREEMPGAVNFGWSLQDVRDVMGYSRTLPTK